MAKNSIFEGILSFHLQLKNSSPAGFGFFACFLVTSLVQLKAGIVFLKKEISEGNVMFTTAGYPGYRFLFSGSLHSPPPGGAVDGQGWGQVSDGWCSGTPSNAKALEFKHGHFQRKIALVGRHWGHNHLPQGDGNPPNLKCKNGDSNNTSVSICGPPQ